METKISTNGPGYCPNCGSDNLEYGASEPQDCHIAYPFTCEDCGTKGNEVNAVEFAYMEYEEAE